MFSGMEQFGIALRLTAACSEHRMDGTCCPSFGTHVSWSSNLISFHTCVLHLHNYCWSSAWGRITQCCQRTNTCTSSCLVVLVLEKYTQMEFKLRLRVSGPVRCYSRYNVYHFEHLSLNLLSFLLKYLSFDLLDKKVVYF